MPGPVPYTFAHTETAGLSGFQGRSEVVSRPTKVLFVSSPLVFSKPHATGRGEEGAGGDWALCEPKQKSLSTMNNKSIQKKKNPSSGGRADCSQSTAFSKNEPLPRGHRATPLAASAPTCEQEKPNMMTRKTIPDFLILFIFGNLLTCATFIY